MKLPPRCRFVVVLALSLITSAPSAFALGQSATPATSEEASKVSKRHAEIAAARKIPSRDFEQIVPYWTTEGGWHTELQLRNNLTSDSLKVTPVLRSANGTDTPLNDVTVLPGEVKTIDLHRALMEINSSLGSQADAFGSILLRYRPAELQRYDCADPRELQAEIWECGFIGQPEFHLQLEFIDR